MDTPELENDKTRETPTIMNNHVLNNVKKNDTIIASKNNYQITRISRYLSLYTIFQAIGILLIVSVFFWLQNFRNGFGFSKTVNVCNWHPLLMTIAFIYLFANTILHFRNFHNAKKRELKMQHAMIHSCIIIIAILGIWAGFNSNLIAKPPIPKFYSLHSWLGIVTIVIYFVQFVSGFVSYLYPQIAIKHKEAVMPYHITVGVLTFALSMVTTVLGVCEKVMFALDKQYQYMPMEGIFLNILGILLIIYGVLVIYILINPKYKRTPRIEIEVIQTRL